MIWKADGNGNVLYSNSKFRKFINAPAGTALNILDEKIVHPEDYQASLSAFKVGNNEKKPFVVKRRLKCHDGKYYSFLTKGIPFINESTGDILSWYGTCSSADE